VNEDYSFQKKGGLHRIKGRFLPSALSMILCFFLFIPSQIFAQDKKAGAGQTENSGEKTKEEEESLKQDNNTRSKKQGEEKKEEERKDEMPTAQLGEIVVTASRYEKSTFDIPMGITAVGKQEIIEKGSRTTAEALRCKPGIWIQKTGHIGGSPIIRGFMGKRVIYLFDGIRRNTASLFAGPNPFLQSVDALDIDRIEVIRGPGSVLYGSDAIGGVINVITNEKPLFSSELKYGGRMYSRYASVDQEGSGRLETYFASPKIFGFIGGTRRDIDDLEGGRGVGAQDPSRWQESNWDAQIDYLLSEKHRLEFFVQDYTRPRSYRYDKPDRREEAERELYALRYKGCNVGFIKKLEFTTYFQNQERFKERLVSGSWVLDSVRDDETFGAEVQAISFPAKNIRLVYGIHYHKDDLERSDPRKGTEMPDVTWDNPAVFVLSEWHLTKRFRLDLGLRWDRFTLKSDPPPFDKLPSEVQDAINNGSFSLDALDLDETDDALTGGIGAVYSLTENLNLVGHIGRAFRAPNRGDMLDFGEFTYGFKVPSGDLDPESSWTYEIGLRAQHDDFAGAFTCFYTEVHDAIVSVPGTFGGATYIDVNGNGVEDPREQVYVKTNSDDKIIAQGVELEAKYYLPSEWAESIIGKGVLSSYGNFTWVYGKDKGQDEPLDRAFPTNALLGLRWEDERDPKKRKYWVALEAWMVRKFDRIPSTRQTRDPAFWNNPQDRNSGLLRADGSVPGFTIFNLRGRVKLSENATLSLGIENLTDKKYRVKDSRIDGPGLNFVVALDIKF
jgi:outer membrane receptor protein involved in Fe transport